MPEQECRVTFETEGLAACVPAGSTLREAARFAGVRIDAPCGGLGTCGRCAVIAAGSLEEPSADEKVLLAEDRLAAGIRLACKARVTGDVCVRPETTATPETLRIVDAGDIEVLSIEPPERRGIVGAGPLLGAVVDIGTTTVVVALVDLRTGEQLASASALNPQHAFGHDVMSRITHASVHGTDALRAPILGTITSLTRQVLDDAGRDASSLREIAIAGNTTMIHLLLGIDPAPLGVAPYEPTFVAPVERPATEIGLDAFPDARAYVLPGISAFVGADITAGLLVTRLAERVTPAVLIDLGTNGEIVVRTRGGLVASSTAAGPALEGANIACGMRAETGAVERVVRDGDGLSIATIGDAEPRGICGSGLLDLIAVLLDAGVIDHTGRLRADTPHPLAARVADVDGSRSFFVAPGVRLTQRDVRQVQLANAAIASGLEMLLEVAGVTAEEVGEVVIAGGFGYHVKAEALTRMGMVPSAWADRIRFAGNTAKTGATAALLDSEARRRAEALARHVETVDLASHPGFQERFVRVMRFPRGDAR